MSVINLEYLFKPRSVAVIGATNDPQNAGNIVMRNIMAGGFMGRSCRFLIRPRPFPASLPILRSSICPRPRTWPWSALRSIRCLRSSIPSGSGVPKARYSWGPFRFNDSEEHLDVKSTILALAEPPNFRIIGPKSLGFMIPSLNLNASLAHASVGPGKVAFISQSDSLFVTVLDWAIDKGVGFPYDRPR